QSTITPRAERPSSTSSRMLSSSSTTRIQRPCKAEAFCATTSGWRVADPGERAAVPRSFPAGVLGGIASLSAGRETVNIAPPSGRLWASMLPPCCRTIAMQLLNPRPGPPPGRLVVEDGAQSLGGTRRGRPRAWGGRKQAGFARCEPPGGLGDRSDRAGAVWWRHRRLFRATVHWLLGWRSRDCSIHAPRRRSFVPSRRVFLTG